MPLRREESPPPVLHDIADPPQRVLPPAPEALPVDWAADLAALLTELRYSSNPQQEMERIQRVANLSFSRWLNYPKPVQRALVGNLACRLRHLQDHVGVNGAKLDAAFRSLTRFSKSYQPGWVNGLTRGRGPAAETWLDEARCWWDQLDFCTGDSVGIAGFEEIEAAFERQIDEIQGWIAEWKTAPDVAKPMCMDKAVAAIRLVRRVGLPVNDPRLNRCAGEIYDHLEVPLFRRLRQAIRDQEVVLREDQGNGETEAVAPDWPWWSHTVGRRGLIIGGTLDESQRVRIERTFGFASLRWDAFREHPNASARLKERLGGGPVELVLLLDDMNDAETSTQMIRVCQEMGVPWALVDPAHGVARTRIAIERFLQPDSIGGNG